MNETLIISHCVSMPHDHCICTYICLICLYVFYIPLIVRTLRGKFRQWIHAWYISEELFCNNINISLSMCHAVTGLFLSWDIRKCLISGLRCYSISNLIFVLFFTLLLLCHGDLESSPGPKESGTCQHLKFCH